MESSKKAKQAKAVPSPTESCQPQASSAGMAQANETHERPQEDDTAAPQVQVVNGQIVVNNDSLAQPSAQTETEGYKRVEESTSCAPMLFASGGEKRIPPNLCSISPFLSGLFLKALHACMHIKQESQDATQAANIGVLREARKDGAMEQSGHGGVFHGSFQIWHGLQRDCRG